MKRFRAAWDVPAWERFRDLASQTNGVGAQGRDRGRRTSHVSATGVTTGEYLRGVDFSANTAVTHSVIMRSKTGSVRYMDARHNLAKLREIAAVVLD